MMENHVSRWQAHSRSSSGGIFSMESHSSRTVVSTWREETGSDNIRPKNTNFTPREVSSYLSLFTLCVPTGGVGVSATVSVSLPAPPPVPGLHFVQVVHAARRLDEKGGVSPAVTVAVAPDSAVVGEGAGRLAVEGVTVPWLPHLGSSAGSWSKGQSNINWLTSIFLFS